MVGHSHCLLCTRLKQICSEHKAISCAKHLGALVGLECGLFGDIVTNIYINDLGEPEVTGLLLDREFILAAMHYN